jgi:hypothetical protein
MDLALPPDFKEFLSLLNTHGVKYLVIEGYAVGYQATLAPRATWISGSPESPTMPSAWLRRYASSAST